MKDQASRREEEGLNKLMAMESFNYLSMVSLSHGMSDCIRDWREVRCQGEALWHAYKVDGAADNSGKVW